VPERKNLDDRQLDAFDVAFDACGVALGLLLLLSVQSQRARA